MADLNVSEAFVREYMDKLLVATCDDNELECAVARFQNLCHHLLASETPISMKGVGDAADWFGFETSLWKLGEDLRNILRRNKKLRGRNKLLDAFVRIAVDQRFGKGRQPFVLMLGAFGRQQYSSEIGRLLEDPEVYGHAIDALLHDKSFMYGDQVAAIVANEKAGWIRAAGKKYLSKCASGAE